MPMRNSVDEPRIRAEFREVVTGRDFVRPQIGVRTQHALDTDTGHPARRPELIGVVQDLGIGDAIKRRTPILKSLYAIRLAHQYANTSPIALPIRFASGKYSSSSL